MKWHDVEHNTEEWELLRVAKLTGSSFQKIMTGSHAENWKPTKVLSEPAKALAKNIAAERITGRPSQSLYRNQHMDRGHDQEPIAKQIYENRFFAKLDGGGFFDHGLVGVSPDCLIDDDGVGEVKSVIANVHYNNVLRGSFDPSYKWQYIGNLHYTQRDYMHTVSYCADFDDDHCLFTCLIERESVKKEIEMLLERIEFFFTKVDEFEDKILNAKYEVKYEGSE